MAVLSAQKMPVDGFVPTYSAADSAGDEIAPGGGIFAVIKNDGSGSIDATVSIPVTHHGAVDVTKTIAAGDEVWVPLPVRSYEGHEARKINQTSTLNAAISYTGVTSVTVAAIQAL